MSNLKTLLKIFGSCSEFEFWVFLKNNGSYAFICEIISILYYDSRLFWFSKKKKKKIENRKTAHFEDFF